MMRNICAEIIGRRYLIGLISLIGLFVSCDASQDIETNAYEEGQTPITFNMGSANMTRADENSLFTEIGDFRVYGLKGTLSDDKTTFSTSSTSSSPCVFDNYIVWYDTNASTSNPDANWEYVGGYAAWQAAKNANGSDKYSSSVTGDDLTAINAQRTKYWDYSKNAYYFWAVGNGTEASFSSFDTTNGIVTKYSKTLTVNGTSTLEGGTLYYTEPTYVPKANYGNAVKLVFKRMMSKVRFGFYSSVKGWNVSSIHFYKSGESTAQTDNTLYINGGIPTSATAEINYSYADYSDPKSSSAVTSTANSEESYPGFGTVAVSESSLMSTSISLPTYNSKGYVAMIPAGKRTSGDDLTIRCDYTLKSADSDETLVVKDAYVTISADDCNWQPNNAYTYIFKLVGGTLNPIVLDAFYTSSVSQTTATTIEDATKPTITTCPVGSFTSNTIIFKTGVAIDVTVMYDGDDKTQATDLKDKLVIKDPSENIVNPSYSYSDDANTKSVKATFTPSATGTYTATYTYTDSSSNPATVKKEIIVE